MSKPRVPEDHILFDGLLNDFFSGDTAAQAKAIDAVTESVNNARGGVYVIIGATRTGKGTAFAKSAESVKAGSADVFISENYSGAREERQALAQTAAGKKLIRLNTDVEVQFLPEEIKQANAIAKDHPNATIVIDALLHEPRIPSSKVDAGLMKDQQMLKEIAAANPEITFLHTQHDLAQLKTALWDMNQKLTKDFSYTGSAIRTEVLDGQKGAHADAVIKALNTNNRATYDEAFDRIFAQSTGQSSFTKKSLASRGPLER